MYKRLIIIAQIIFFACSVASCAETAAQSEQEGFFNGTFADALWTVITFLVLLLVLSKTAWKPLLKILANRQHHIEHELSHAEKTRLNAEKLLDDYKQQSREIIERSTRHAQMTEKEIIDKAGKEALVMKQKAISEIDHAKDLATQQLWQQMGDMVLTLSKEILRRSITHDDNKRLINEAIARLQQEHSGTQK
jgi:F-type H+-transporting ATPase subunit b